MTEDSTARAEFLQKADLIPDARLREGEPDAFRHLPIAARVAELAVHAETPVNIALFGPWGSGKSSFFELLRGELEQRDRAVVLVRYDAWKYGGGALKRNFISSAATELGMEARKKEARKFHRGLYENKRTVQFDPLELFRRGDWWEWVKILVFAAAFTTIAVAALAGWIAAFSDRDVTDEISRLAPGIGAQIGGFVLAVGAALKVLDGAKVEVEQVVPSEDEQFADLFRDLVGEAKKHQFVGTTTQRLVFFIDELDRCLKADVVSTLTSLRTFLDQEDCVFVVAADREVLEEALDVVPQATPVREEEPYYSSASAFLDKIFQHQFALPPLRGGRLTGFARDLVQDRGGLWKELRDEGALNGVLYTLIPSHVRAPRRVKVLLNNFATNARVSEARGVDWLTRAEEIAKLTVLQTEFPRLAGDLYEEPRLLAMLLAPPAHPTGRQRGLLARHRITELPEAQDEAKDDEYEAPDRLLNDGASVALLSRQREDLHRYLQSRRAPDPGRDLLYLEVVGDWVGLDDPDINRLIEDEAPSRPDLVVEALRQRPVEERLAAARLLGHLSEREFGQERRNIVTAMTGVLSASVPDDLGDLGDLLANVVSFRAEQEPSEEQLPGLLVLAIAGGEQGRDLASAVLASDALLDTPARLSLVARLLPQLPDEGVAGVEIALAQSYTVEPEILLNVISDQPAPAVVRLLETATPTLVSLLTPVEEPTPQPATPGSGATSPTVEAVDSSDSLGTGPDDERIHDLTDQLLDALDNRGSELLEAKARLIAALLEGGDDATYGPCRQRGPDVALQLDDADLRNQILLDGLFAGPGGDWRRWAEPLAEQPDGRKDSRCERALMAVLDKLQTESPEVQATASDTIRDLLRSDGDVRPDDADTTAAIVPVITAHLAALEWWASDASAAAQSTIYEVARILGQRFHEALGADLAAALTADLGRGDPALVAWDADIARRLADMATAAPPSVLAEAERIATSAVGDGALLARLSIAEQRRSLGEDVPPVQLAEVIEAGNSGGGSGDEVTATWLRLDPPVSDVGAVVKALTRVRRLTVEALQQRSESLGSAEAAELFLDLIDADADHGWLGAVGAHSDVSAALDGVAERMARARGTTRDSLVKAAATLTMTSPSQRQIVGQMALTLLSSEPNQSKSEVAAALIQLVHADRYGLKAQVKDAVIAADAGGKLGDKARKRFENMGVIAGKRKKRKFLGIDLRG